MMDVVVESMVATLEYDCLGSSRKSDMLTEAFRASPRGFGDSEVPSGVNPRLGGG